MHGARCNLTYVKTVSQPWRSTPGVIRAIRGRCGLHDLVGITGEAAGAMAKDEREGEVDRPTQMP